MNRPLTLLTLASLSLLVPPAFSADTDLRVTRLALFNSGVGYFQCDATVGDNAAVELKFRTEQVNDIIKSLVVQDFDGGTIGSVGYASRDPIDRTLRSFAVDITGRPSLAQLLEQLRGEAVEISGSRGAKGMVVGVEKRKKPVGDSSIETEVVNVFTDGGVVQVEIAEIERLRFTNEKINSELRKALETLANSHDADKKTVRIEFLGKGNRRVRAAYLLETPIWKTSYRLVLGDAPERKPFLQGWATVENATEEDWNDVRLSLVSGRPISFRMDLYTPIYIPRPVEQLELYASLRAPEFAAGLVDRDDAGADGQFARRRRVSERLRAEMKAPGAPPAPAAAAIGGAGGRFNDALAESTTAGAEFMKLDLEGGGVASVAEAQEAGELFEYVISEPVSIGRQRSAMLPIVNQAVTAEKVSIYNPATHPRHPLNGLKLTNDTPLHLMQGPVTIFDGDVYAGDAKLPDLKPAESRLVGYALDLGTDVQVESKSHPASLVSLKIVRGVLWHRHKYVDERTYTIRNKVSRPRTVILEQPWSSEWKLVEPAEPYERAGGLLRFRVNVGADAVAMQPVRLEWVREEQVALLSMNSDALLWYVNSGAASDKLKAALNRAIELRQKMDQTAQAAAIAERRAADAAGEQGRVRENLKTLDRSSDSYRKQLAKFDQLETEIETTRKEAERLRGEEAAQRVALENYLAALEIE
ncbi:MAG: hypothetical protein HRU75_12320 [Planctomycetia bacterium]|nr:MAG: hypothetical protein HRU75_12320 [Planctomycetia bacterium]